MLYVNNLSEFVLKLRFSMQAFAIFTFVLECYVSGFDIRFIIWV